MALKISEIEEALKTYQKEKNVKQTLKTYAMSFVKRHWGKITILILTNIIVIYALYKVKKRILPSS